MVSSHITSSSSVHSSAFKLDSAVKDSGLRQPTRQIKPDCTCSAKYVSLYPSDASISFTKHTYLQALVLHVQAGKHATLPPWQPVPLADLTNAQ